MPSPLPGDISLSLSLSSLFCLLALFSVLSFSLLCSGSLLCSVSLLCSLSLSLPLSPNLSYMLAPLYQGPRLMNLLYFQNLFSCREASSSSCRDSHPLVCALAGHSVLFNLKNLLTRAASPMPKVARTHTHRTGEGNVGNVVARSHHHTSAAIARFHFRAPSIVCACRRFRFADSPTYSSQPN